jgi:hypothetical protein
MKNALAAFVMMVTAAHAEAPLTGAEFDAYTQGKTLTYIENGQSYGIEEYRPGQQVKWAFEGDDCQDGHWWEEQTGLICFAYDNAPDAPQCWNFYKSDRGLRAMFAGDSDNRARYEAQQAHAPMLCLGPEVGA